MVAAMKKKNQLKKNKKSHNVVEEQPKVVAERPRSLPPASGSAPWLVFIHWKKNKCHQTFFSVSESRFYVRHVRELTRSWYRCWASPQGWLLVLDAAANYPSCFLLNPTTMQRVELPPPGQLQQPPRDDRGPVDDSHNLVLSSSTPTDPDTVVVFLDRAERRLLFLRIGSDRGWTGSSSSLEDRGGGDVWCIAASGGQLYGQTSRGRLVLIDADAGPCGPRMTLLETERPRLMPGLCAHIETLVESCGELYLVVRSLLLGTLVEADIKVHKLVQSDSSSSEEQQQQQQQHRWEAVDSIGDRVFFLGQSSGACSASYSASKLGLKQNRIYFLREEDLCLYAFDMARGVVLVDLPCPNVRPPRLEPFWIMPSS